MKLLIPRVIAPGLAAWLSLGTTANGNVVVVRYADCKPGVVSLSGNLGPGAPPAVNINIPMPMPAQQVRDSVMAALLPIPTIFVTPLDTDSVVLRHIPPGAAVTAASGGTKSTQTVRTAGCPHGAATFTGTFNPFEAPAIPAVFTAGIVTDVGELTAQVSAAELTFQTDGPIICQALFQRLQPHAPQYGATINYFGDRLEVYFDPAYTVTQGGIVFGTTSPTPGAAGSVDVPVVPPPVDHPRIRFLDDGGPGQWGFFFEPGPQLPEITHVVPFLVPSDPNSLRNVAAASIAANTALLVETQPLASMIVHPLPSLFPYGARIGTSMTTCSITSSDCNTAMIDFDFHFTPFDPENQPAIFTAGIVTDVGELSVQVSAQELNFQTDGPIICQALFQRLVPRAPQYGSQINYAGDRLEVYFDPAYSVTQGGIIFGTTSPSPGCSGVINPPSVPPAGSGDMNCDGTVDGLDIDPLLKALFDPNGFKDAYPGCDIDHGDMNGDGVVDLLDWNPFVEKLLGN